MSNLKKFGSGILVVFACLLLGSYTYIHFYKSKNNPKISKLKLQAGFVAEHIYSPSENNQGSWVSMTFDHKGRMIASDQYGGIYRLEIPAIGSVNLSPKIEKILIGKDSLNFGAAHGLLYAFNSLYVMVNNYSTKELPKTSGFYRLQDTNNDDQYDKLTLLKELVGDGEHGPHSVMLSPDKQSIYLISGNHTDVPNMDEYIYPKNWQEDNLFPLIKDPRGHANDRMAPGGWIANVDSTGKNWKLVSAGYRNAFDMAFNDLGDLFVYDADMEWDFGTPWYRPTRVTHATSASEFGWRTGNSKWMPSFPDNLPPVVNIGQGSPTNLMYLKNAKFPAKYNQTLLAFDWSFGIIHAIHLKPEGSSYTAEREEFLSGIPLPLTDGAIGPDGALYFMTGGRKIASDLYRVYYNGPEKTDTKTITKLTPENTLRRSLEKFHGVKDLNAVGFAWQSLKNPDRFIRYAARLAIEHQPVSEWQEKVFIEKDPIILINSALALVRNGNASQKSTLLNALLKIKLDDLTIDQKLDLMRVYELIMLRMGKPDDAIRLKIISLLNPKYPSTNDNLNKELAKLLIHLESPGVVPKTLALIEKNYVSGAIGGGSSVTSSADLIMRNPQYGLDIANTLNKTPQILPTYYATMLSQAKNGWTPAFYERYFKWYKKAFGFKGGLSYVGFIDKARKMALKNVPENKRSFYDKMSGGDELSKSGNEVATHDFPKGPYKNWNIKDAKNLFNEELESRNFKQGKSMYNSISCNQCHAIQGEGGNVGPELSQLASRFSQKDIIEAIMEPNKSVSDQYAATQFELNDGKSIVGRLVNEDKVNYFVSQNPYAPDVIMKISKAKVKSKKYALLSLMPGNLLNPLNAEELKDLMAYLISGGKEDHKVFSKN